MICFCTRNSFFQNIVSGHLILQRIKITFSCSFLNVCDNYHQYSERIHVAYACLLTKLTSANANFFSKRHFKMLMNFTGNFPWCLAHLFCAPLEPKGLKDQEQKNHLTWNLNFLQEKNTTVVVETWVNTWC